MTDFLGAIYYYNTLNGTGPSANYPATFAAVIAEARSHGFTYGSLQLDSFWYPKRDAISGEVSCAWSPLGSGLDVWEACTQPGFFPDGLRNVSQEVFAGAGVAAHSRWIAPNSSYITRYSDLTWVVSPKAALPREFRDFYVRMMSHAVDEFGMVLYEQDWTGQLLQAVRGCVLTLQCTRRCKLLPKPLPFPRGTAASHSSQLTYLSFTWFGVTSLERLSAG